MTEKDQFEELAYLIKDISEQRCQYVSCEKCEFVGDPICEEKLIAKHLLKHDFRRMSSGVICAMEKQIPSRVSQRYVSKRRKHEKGYAGYCPTCGGTVEFRKTFLRLLKKENYCTWCGQSLDWNERESENEL